MTLSEPREVTATFDLEQAVEFTLTTSRGITATTGSNDAGDDCTAGCRYNAALAVREIHEANRAPGVGRRLLARTPCASPPNRWLLV